MGVIQCNTEGFKCDCVCLLVLQALCSREWTEFPCIYGYSWTA